MGERRGVSTAEKRAQLAAAGEPWPKYPDGTDMLWYRSARYAAGGYWPSFESVEKHRSRTRVANMTPESVEKHRARNRVANMTPECVQQKREHQRERNAERLYAGGMYLGYSGFTPHQKEMINGST